jgi:hypothetical protein
MLRQDQSESSRRRDSLVFAYACFLLFWSLCQAYNIVDCYLRDSLSIQHSQGKEYLSDFVHFYIAGTIAGSDNREHIYDPKIQDQTYKAVVGEEPRDDGLFTQHVPMLFAAMIPFASLPLNLSHLIWDIISFIIGATGLIFLETVMLGKSIKLKVIFFLAILASFPSWQTFINGQLSWLLLGLVCGFILAMVHRNDLSAGLFLALCSIKPQYLPFLALPAFFQKRYGIYFWAFVFEGLIVFFTAEIVGFGNFLAYPTMIGEAEANAAHVAPHLMPCARGLLSAVFDQKETFSMMLPLALFGLAMLTTMFFLRRRQLNTQEGLCWAMRAAILAGLFFSPHTHAYDCLLIGAAAVLLDDFSSASRLKHSLSLRVWTILLLSYPATSWICFFLGVLWPAIGMKILGLINFALLICALNQFWQLNDRPAHLSES